VCAGGGMMVKYRKKPIVIEAEQWFPGKKIDSVLYRYDTRYDDDDNYYINTLEGTMKVSPGDYIITGIEGEKYPCKSTIFEKTHEKVE